jgi:hypothetical protein
METLRTTICDSTITMLYSIVHVGKESPHSISTFAVKAKQLSHYQAPHPIIYNSSQVLVLVLTSWQNGLRIPVSIR